jgi:predicted outer membrane protein
MRNFGTVAVLGVLVFPGLVAAGDAPQNAKKTGWWPAAVEKTTRDALLFSQEMMARIHYANQNAIQVGRLAKEHGNSAEVQRYGRLLATDGQVLDKQLIDYAQRRMGVTLGLPQFVMEAERDLSLQRTARVERLSTLGGAEFDGELLELAVSDIQSAFELVDHARIQVDDPDLRIMFDKTMPILQQHGMIAHVLSNKISSGGR